MPVPESSKLPAIEHADQCIVHSYLAYICFIQCTQDMQQCTFARTRWTCNGYHLAPADLYVHPLEYFHRTIAFVYIFSGKHAACWVFNKSNIRKSRYRQKRSWPKVPDF
jgi:hypothetical protein